MKRWEALNHAPAFSMMTELRRTGVDVRTGDIDWYAWEPREQRITVGDHLSPDVRRYLATLALAHRALGHVGNSAAQDDEALALACYWLGERQSVRLAA